MTFHLKLLLMRVIIAVIVDINARQSVVKKAELSNKTIPPPNQ
jgi:hypothetical protein